MKNLTISLACLALACGGQGDLDVGDETGNLGQSLSDYAASWDGYAEAFAFPGDGEDRVRLTLDENGAGVIQFGDEALFPAAVDPNGFYPPTFGISEGSSGLPLQPLQGLRSGFAFAVTGAQVSDQRLQLQANVGQVMESWCALQVLEPVPGWSCGGSGYGVVISDPVYCHTANGTDTRIDCELAYQCQACECDSSSCGAVKNEYDALEFDATLTDGGNALEGTLVTNEGARVTIRMVR